MTLRRAPSVATLTISLLLSACSTTTNPGAADITRKQLLIMPAERRQ